MAVIIFDIDDTLYLRSEPYLRTYREFFGDRLRLDEKKLLHANHIHKEELFQKRSRGEITMEEMLAGRTMATYRDFGVELSRQEALRFEELYAENLKSIRMQPAFRELLEELFKAEVPIGVLTNGPSDRQREKLQALGAEKYFPERLVMASGDVGIVKPDEEIFRAYEKKTGFAPGELWMVGDSLESDILGAARAGWHTIWLNRKREEFPEEPELSLDFASDSEKELCEFVRRIV